MLNGLNVKCGECGARNKESVKLRNLIHGEKRKMRWIKEKVHKETDLETIDKLRKELYIYQNDKEDWSPCSQERINCS